MRIGFCADVHAWNHKRHGGPIVAGMNIRCRLVVSAFANAIATASLAEADAFVVLGDLVDGARPEPQILTALQKPLRAWHEDDRDREKVILLCGNHDRNSDAPGDHALGPLAPFARIVESPEILSLGDGRVELALVPHVAGDPTKPPDVTFPAVRDRSARHHRILGVHRGISDASTPVFLRGLDYRTASIWAGKNGADALFAGDWHERRSWRFDDPETAPRGMLGFPAVHQCGALVPTGWDNPGFSPYGQLLLYDTDTKKVEVRYIPGPRFVKVWSLLEAENAARIAAQERSTLFVQVVAAPAEVEAAVKAVEHLINAGTILAGEVEPETAGALAAAREAASAARAGTTLDESLAGFVAEMALDVGVERDAVLARARALLGLSAVGPRS